MEKYRIIQIDYVNSEPCYNLQKRVWFFWWETLYFKFPDLEHRSSLFFTWESVVAKLEILQDVAIVRKRVVKNPSKSDQLKGLS